MKQIRSAARIARQIQQTERAMDQTILEANALLAAMIEARREGNFAAEVGQHALEDVVRSIKSLMEARGAIVSGHSNLAKVAKDLAIEWRMDGPLEEKIKDREVPTFRAVEQNAA
jgi:tRNA isopentenyl-2-thiomethyl-A-37 hydroxylase MiaE